MIDELTFQGTAEYKIDQMKEYSSNLREVKQELLKDHKGLIDDGDSVCPEEDAEMLMRLMNRAGF